jgi:DNA modification methylase
MSKISLYKGDFRKRLPEHCKAHGDFKMLFADPPDNISWGYEGYDDNMQACAYRELLSETIRMGAAYSEIFWMSFNVNHMILVGDLLHFYKDRLCKDWDIRFFVQYTTFGMNVKNDFSRCFRPLVRIMRKGAVTYPDAIRIESERQRIGDKRADPRGKIPPDVWAIHRVTGNAKQRRKWHPTQLNEALYERCLDYSCRVGDRAGDLFAGTGTIARAAKGKELDITLFEISEVYCQKISEEHQVRIL